MTTNAEVEKQNNENNASVMRRFSRKVKSSGLLPHLKKKRYFERTRSDNVRRKQRLKKIRRKQQVDRLIKLGKIADKTARR